MHLSAFTLPGLSTASAYRGPLSNRNAANTPENYAEFRRIGDLVNAAHNFFHSNGRTPIDVRGGGGALLPVPWGVIGTTSFGTSGATDGRGGRLPNTAIIYGQCDSRGGNCAPNTIYQMSQELIDMQNAANGWGNEHGYLKSGSLFGEILHFVEKFVVPAVTGYAFVATVGPLLGAKAAAGTVASAGASTFPGIAPAVSGGASFPGVAPVLSTSAPVAAGGKILPSILSFADKAQQVSEVAVGIIGAIKKPGSVEPIVSNDGAGSSGVLVPMSAPPAPAPATGVKPELLLGGLGAILTLVSLLR